MDEWIGRDFSAAEVAQFYKKIPGHWFLMEVLRKDERGKATWVRVVGHDPSKEAMRDLLMDQDAQHEEYIFVWTDPDGNCLI